MPEQFEHTEVVKPQDVTEQEAAAKKRIDRVADEAARKSTKTVQKYDKDRKIFTN